MTTHTINFNVSQFRQALTSALLFVDKSSNAGALNCICLHLEKDGESATVNSLDNHGFYRQRLDLISIKDEAGNTVVAPSLPNGEGAWSGQGQLLIPEYAATAILKLMPKVWKHGFVTLEVTRAADGVDYVRFIGRDEINFQFSYPATSYPDYSGFLSRAEKNKESLSITQGRAFPAKEFARIAKALPEDFFKTYLGVERDGPCLIEQGQDIMIVYMPGKWVEAA